MCGIAGFVGDGMADAALLKRMCDVIAHRGPDEEGSFVEDGVGLGMRRLSIIDLSTGQQPIWNEDKTVAVVYNGESYNFPDVRRDLEARGHRFTTHTDTECVVHLYEEHGDRCVEHLRGMFAFALWDRRRRRLLLARDRVGKKPLYYRHTPDGFWFGSELKALLQDPGFDRRVDLVALHHFLTFQYVPSPWSIYEGVRKLPPAHTLVFENGDVRIERYWRLRYGDKLSISEAEAVEQGRDLIREATRIRLISDVPLGAFLSGGVDSSVVVGAMAEQTSSPVKTFSIGFDDRSFDERSFARMTAERFGTDHHEFVVRPSALDVLPTLVWHYDEPFADSSAVPSWYLARMTRQHVTVALNGDGGDEAFAGYERYVATLLASRLPVPASMGRAGRALVSRVHAGEARSWRRRMVRFADFALSDPESRYARLMSYFTEDQKQALYTDELRAELSGVDSYELLRDLFAASDGPDVLDRTLDVDVQTYLPGDLLVKMDIATMANSLEARSPLLDHKLLEFTAALPSNMKIRGRTSKWLLKRIARGWVPDEVLDRRKMGFGVPLASWLRGELRELTRDTLTDSLARSRGWFKPDAITALLDEHDAGVDHGPRIWALLQLELWHRMFVDQHRVTAPPQPIFRG